MRSVPARIGIAALNLIWPGLGLIRLQRLKAGLRMLAAPFVLTLLQIAASELLRGSTVDMWLAVMLGISLVILGVFGASIVMSWRASAERAPELPWWARWHGLAGIAIACLAAYWPAPDLIESYYEAY